MHEIRMKSPGLIKIRSVGLYDEQPSSRPNKTQLNEQNCI